MHIVIIGGGVIGAHLVFVLSREGHNITVIDENETQIKLIRQTFDVRTIVGNGVVPRVLMEADVPQATIVIACTDNDESNMIICFLAKEMGAKRTIARVRNPEYKGYMIGGATSMVKSRRITRPKTLGIDLFVNPELITSEHIVSVLCDPYITPASEFAGGAIQMREFHIDNKSITEQPIGRIRFLQPCSIVAIVNSKGVKIPRAEDTMNIGDHVYVISKTESMGQLGSLFSTPMRPPKSVIVLGGNAIGFQVAKELSEKNIQVKLIEADLKRCQQIAVDLEKVTVICGEGIDIDLFLEEGVPLADAFIATTASDELNILAGQLVTGLGVPQSMVVVNKPAYIALAENSNIDYAFSAPLLAANSIVRFASYAQAVTTELIAGERLLVIEYIAQPDSTITENVLGKVELPKDVLIGAILHNGEVVFPHPDYRISPGDSVIIVCVPGISRSVERLF